MAVADRGQRERAIEHTLRRGVAASHAVDAPDTCVDGETLAAWSSGALDAGAAARVEEHLADCARCQTMLAAFVRTEPVAAAPAPWWKRTRARWLVPLATAATVAAIWVAVPSRDQSRPESTVFLDRQLEPSAAEKPPSGDADRQAFANQPAPRVIPAKPTTIAPRTSSEVDAARGTRKETTVAQKPKEESEKLRADESRAAAGARERAANELAAAPPATEAPRPLQETVARDAIAPQRLARTLIVGISSPGDSTRWRIVDGQVQRSTTQGESWESIAFPPTTTIVAGHSPAASVVWLVGKAGAIFLTTDGTQFQQVPFVSSADLTAVVAVDDQRATVTIADGRRFRTENRGLNWSALQP